MISNRFVERYDVSKSFSECTSFVSAWQFCYIIVDCCRLAACQFVCVFDLNVKIILFVY